MSAKMRHKLLRKFDILENCGTCGRTCYPTAEAAELAAKEFGKKHNLKLEAVRCLDTSYKYSRFYRHHIGAQGEDAATRLEWKQRVKARMGYGPPQGKNKVSPKKGRWTKVKDHDDEGERQAL